jgi:hypothetical protein
LISSWAIEAYGPEGTAEPVNGYLRYTPFIQPHIPRFGGGALSKSVLCSGADSENSPFTNPIKEVIQYGKRKKER